MRAFVFFVFDAASSDVHRIVDAAVENGCGCEQASGPGWASVFIEGPEEAVAWIKLLADHVDSGSL